MFNGSKTYIVAFVSVVYAWVSVWAGTMDAGTAMQMTQVALIGGALHHAVVNS